MPPPWVLRAHLRDELTPRLAVARVQDLRGLGRLRHPRVVERPPAEAERVLAQAGRRLAHLNQSQQHVGVKRLGAAGDVGKPPGL